MRDKKPILFKNVSYPNPIPDYPRGDKRFVGKSGLLISDRSYENTVVIPAKAGIHLFDSYRFPLSRE
jgi:hypothetical protein